MMAFESPQLLLIQRSRFTRILEEGRNTSVNEHDLYFELDAMLGRNTFFKTRKRSRSFFNVQRHLVCLNYIPQQACWQDIQKFAQRLAFPFQCI